MPLLIKCSSPCAAPCHPHLRAPPHVCCHVCRAHARPCLSTGWALNRRFDQTFGTVAVLAQGGGGGTSIGLGNSGNSRSEGLGKKEEERAHGTAGSAARLGQGTSELHVPPPPLVWLLGVPVREIILQMHTPVHTSQFWSRQTQH